MEKCLVYRSKNCIRILHTHYRQLTVNDDTRHTNQTNAASLSFPGPDNIPVAVDCQVLASRTGVETNLSGQSCQNVKVTDIPAFFEKPLKQYLRHPFATIFFFREEN